MREKIEVLRKNRIAEEATKKKRTQQKRENPKKESVPEKRQKVEETNAPKEAKGPKEAKETKSTPISDTDTESVSSVTPSVNDVITK